MIIFSLQEFKDQSKCLRTNTVFCKWIMLNRAGYNSLISVQACIDDNLDMVEFLVKHRADVNKGDNEGWTPLHATASCGFISIAKYVPVYREFDLTLTVCVFKF